MSIVVRIKGGIGNQLFMYAAARRLALFNKQELLIDHISGFKYDREYKRKYQLNNFNIPCSKANYFERLEPFSRIRRYFKRAINKKIPFNKRTYLFEEGKNFETQLLNYHSNGTVYLEGYFQSENFFKDIELQIKEDLYIPPPTDDKKSLRMLKKIQDTIAIALHVRFFDKGVITLNQNLQNSSNTSIDYYQRAISKMNQHYPNAHYFIFSNQPQKVINYLPLDQKQMTIIDHNRSDNTAYADLWLMSHCQHFIIAKSTFSWWGAWLSNNKKKTIIAPRIDKDNFNKFLLPKEWTQL